MFYFAHIEFKHPVLGIKCNKARKVVNVLLSNLYIVIVWQGCFSMFFDMQLQGSAIFTLALKTY